MALFSRRPNVERLTAKQDTPKLIKALNHGEPEVSWAAVRALGDLRDSRAVEALCALLTDSARSFRIRTAAAAALGSIRDARAAGPLCAALTDTDVKLRWAAAVALGRLGTRSAAGPLYSALAGDPNAGVRSCAAQALDQIGWEPASGEQEATYHIATGSWDRCVALGPAAIRPLCDALADADETVRSAAAQALDQIGWEPASEEQEAAYHIATRSWDQCAALGPAAIRPLYDALADADPDIRRGAALTLGRIGGPQVTRPLCVALTDPSPAVGTAAAEALGQASDPDVAVLCAALTAQESLLRLTAARLLGLSGDSRATQALCGALTSGDVCDRMAAARALGQIGDPRAVKPLRAALRDRDEQVRTVAAKSLAALGAT